VPALLHKVAAQKSNSFHISYFRAEIGKNSRVSQLSIAPQPASQTQRFKLIA